MNAVAIDNRVVFEVPGGELAFGPGELDMWAGHLTWCYRMLGVPREATIAVQDFGTSPLAYLGSSLLMPTLMQGVAERTGGRLICLDAAPERIVITPDAIRQVEPDVLVVRADVLGLLVDGAKRAGLDLTGGDQLPVIVAVGVDSPPLPAGTWRRLLHVERTMLLAPECSRCGCFHLQAGYYSLDGEQVENLVQGGTQSCELPGVELVDDRCGRGRKDTLFRLPPLARRVRA